MSSTAFAVVRNRLSAWLRRPKKARRDGFSAYLSECRGVIHVGANEGQERADYDRYGLNVIWIEPIPQLFETLVGNLAGYPKQRAIKALVTDQDGEERVLHVASNRGASSSIFDLHMHKDIWPQVDFVEDIPLTTSRLPTALRGAGVDLGDYDAMVLDTQGAELLVLRGAVEILPRMKYIQAEAADFESYKGCATVNDITRFMAVHGFALLRKHEFAQHQKGGKYFDLLFRAANAG